jgi:6-phosphogluconolactonase
MKTTVCFFLSILALLFSGVASAQTRPAAGSTYLLYVGTYTKAESKGIYAFRYNSASGEAKPLGLAAETVNPSFLTIDGHRKFLYAVNEISDYKGAASGAVTAFSIDHGSGKLSRLNEVASRGADPCYIAFDKAGKYLLVANYTGGNIAVFPVQSDGRVGEASASVQHSGSSVNKQRQEGPHAHWIETTADNRFAIAADLGLDKLLLYRFDKARGSLSPNDPAYAAVEPGAGPRHVAIAPNQKFAYSVNELGSTVTAFTFDPAHGALHPFQTISTLPKEFSGENDTAEIHVHPGGRFLFASNRGHDSIAVFSIDKASGRLTPAGDFSTEGKTPRNFEIDPSGSRLLVANQDSGNIVMFRIDPNTGALKAGGQVLHVPSPVSLKFVRVE